MRLTVPILPSKAFTWSKDGAGVSEMSDLSFYQSGQLWSQLYDDACDIGFGIRSDKTNKIIYFSMGADDVRDGEITGWNFISECGKFKLLIIND